MITAEEAKRKSIISIECKQYFDKLDEVVRKASDKGERLARIKINLTGCGHDKEVAHAMITELKGLGYGVELVYATYNTSNYPPDKTGMVTGGYIKLTW